MNLTKCFAAILLTELFFAFQPFVSCLQLHAMIKETKILLTYSGWKDILDNAKTKTAEGKFGDDDVAMLFVRNEDITKENIIDLVNHIFLMLNCRYSNRLMRLSTIVNDLAIECGYYAYPDKSPSISNLPITFCEDTLLTAFNLISIDLTYAYSALKYFHSLSSDKIASKDICPTISSFKRSYNRFLVVIHQAISPTSVRIQLQAPVNSLKRLDDELNEYFNQNCREETGYPDLWTSYLIELYNLKQQSNLHQVINYLQKKIVEVSDDITENHFRTCGFLYSTETKKCKLIKPETSSC